MRLPQRCRSNRPRRLSLPVKFTLTARLLITALIGACKLDAAVETLLRNQAGAIVSVVA
jgi:hypothetical protein